MQPGPRVGEGLGVSWDQYLRITTLWLPSLIHNDSNQRMFLLELGLVRLSQEMHCKLYMIRKKIVVEAIEWTSVNCEFFDRNLSSYETLGYYKGILGWRGVLGSWSPKAPFCSKFLFQYWLLLLCYCRLFCSSDVVRIWLFHFICGTGLAGGLL